jgi:TATA-box binding protein (TBP) (component of TFIID and TFIIIB)
MEVFPFSVRDLIVTYAGLRLPELSTLKESTLTAEGIMSNVSFMEEDHIYLADVGGRIVKVYCNYGELSLDDPNPPVAQRGRRRRVKEQIDRIRQGNGKCFDSQITYWVKALDNTSKNYKIKVFRNGKVAVPGGLRADMSDIRDAIDVVVEQFRDIYIDPTIELQGLHPTMRNYGMHLTNPDLRIDLPQLKILMAGHYRSIKYNRERYSGVIMKIGPVTVKVFNSGKINIDGAVNPNDAYDVSLLLGHVMFQAGERVVYKKAVPPPCGEGEDPFTDPSTDAD